MNEILKNESFICANMVRSSSSIRFTCKSTAHIKAFKGRGLAHLREYDFYNALANNGHTSNSICVIIKMENSVQSMIKSLEQFIMAPSSN